MATRRMGSELTSLSLSIEVSSLALQSPFGLFLPRLRLRCESKSVNLFATSSTPTNHFEKQHSRASDSFQANFLGSVVLETRFVLEDLAAVRTNLVGRTGV